MARLQRHDDVAARRLGAPVRDHQDAPLPGGSEHAVQELVGQPGVETAGGLVEHEDVTGGQQGPGHREAPALAARQRDAVFTDGRVDPVGQRGDPGLEAGGAQCLADLLLGGVGPA